jgi:hypothetical protein
MEVQEYNVHVPNLLTFVAGSALRLGVMPKHAASQAYTTRQQLNQVVQS